MIPNFGTVYVLGKVLFIIFVIVGILTFEVPWFFYGGIVFSATAGLIEATAHFVTFLQFGGIFSLLSVGTYLGYPLWAAFLGMLTNFWGSYALDDVTVLNPYVRGLIYDDVLEDLFMDVVHKNEREER